MFITSAPVPAEQAVTGVAPVLGRPAAQPLVIGRDISPAEAARLSGEGLVTRCVADIVVRADTWVDRETRAECLGLLMRREGVDPDAWAVGHEAAAWMYLGALRPDGDRAREAAQEPVRSWVSKEPPAPLERVVVLGARGRSPRYAGVVVHHQATLDEDEVTTVSGIRLTSPARTAADLLRLLPAAAAAAELDRLRAATSVTAEAIGTALNRRRGARGLAGARRVLQQWAAAESMEQR